MSWEQQLAALDDFYPGSSQKISRPTEVPQTESVQVDEPGWDAKPWYYLVEGLEYEFFTIGHLSKALNRPAVTLRNWEDNGILPLPLVRSNSEYESKRRRLYTRPQVEGMRQIAKEEGLLSPDRPSVTHTRFKERVLVLFAWTAKEPVYGALPREAQETA